MKYKISSRARLDLANIWEYTFKNWLSSQADQYYKLLVDKMEEICLRPDIGRKIHNVREGYWGIHVKSHIIFYKVQTDFIEVVRILHQRMDYQNRLKS